MVAYQPALRREGSDQMIEEYFHSTRVRRRLVRSGLGPVYEDLVEHLALRRHSVLTIQQYVQSVEHFDGWLRKKGLSVGDINEEVVQRFLIRHLPRCRCRKPKGRTLHPIRAALNHLLIVLRETGKIEFSATPRTLIEKLVADFVMHLKNHGGIAESTCVSYSRYAREFLEDGQGAGGLDFSRVDHCSVSKFIGARHGRWCTGSQKAAATGLRSFFRYLQLIGVINEELALSVPTIPLWKLSSVPRVLNENQVKAIFGSFEKKKPIELRRYASAMCLAHLGLRACEVSAITLDDIDWKNATIRIPSTKTRRFDFLPLPIPVARAILDYLRHGRPQTEARQIFVCHAPPGVPAKPGIIRDAVRIAVKRAGLDPHIGPHAFRHTIATRMLDSGATIKQVSDVLRHRTIDTAAIYAKVNLPALREVAAPWPGSPA